MTRKDSSLQHLSKLMVVTTWATFICMIIISIFKVLGHTFAFNYGGLVII